MTTRKGFVGNAFAASELPPGNARILYNILSPSERMLSWLELSFNGVWL